MANTATLRESMGCTLESYAFGNSIFGNKSYPAGSQRAGYSKRDHLSIGIALERKRSCARNRYLTSNIVISLFESDNEIVVLLFSFFCL